MNIAPYYFEIKQCYCKKLYSVMQVFLVCMLSCFIMQPSAKAATTQSFSMFEPSIVFDASGVVLQVACVVDNEEAIRTMLKDGAVLSLAINVNIEGQRSWWLNKEIADQNFVSTIRHNALTREYSVTLPQPDGDATLHDRNLTRLLHATWRKLAISILSEEAVKQLDADREYAITVVAEVIHAEVPPWLQNSMGFWSAEVIGPVTKKVYITLPQ